MRIAWSSPPPCTNGNSFPSSKENGRRSDTTRGTWRAEERRTLDRLERGPFLVVRAAGSHGFDLVAMRAGFAFPIEAKASADEVIRFSSASGRASEQLHEHLEAAKRGGLVVLYAYRRLGAGAENPGESTPPRPTIATTDVSKSCGSTYRQSNTLGKGTGCCAGRMVSR